MRDLSFTSEDAYKKRLTYFKVIYFLGLAVTLVYLLKFNYQYGVSKYNPILIPTWITLLLIPPLSLRFSNNYLVSASILCVMAVVIVSYFLYLSGGIDAPGIFWLTAIPLICGILVGVPGAVLGYAIVTMVLIFFWYARASGFGPNIIAQYGNYGQEKLFNIILFLLFSGFNTHYYIRGEKSLMKNLEEKNLDIENLLRVLIHDIANTLSTMTYNLVKAKEDREEHSLSSLELDKIERAVDDIVNLLAQVRHLKSVKDGKAVMPLKPLNLTMVLNEVYENTVATAQQKGIKLQLDISRDRMPIHGEKTILSNVVLSNLINNAIKFSHPGERIDLRAYPTETEVVIEIRDYGIGIPKEILANIFNLNSQTTRPGTQGEKGTGYGMPLVREYLQMMDGTIEVFSSEETSSSAQSGTHVILKLPLAKTAI
ncbi:HAMP domain-containing sensor histidine kinase [Bdellovibrio sp.]|uniref:sensor histidine kinase n=1 Tax=Bdellovibrio sp. TaxID=28201 RepID=UPI0032217158